MGYIIMNLYLKLILHRHYKIEKKKIEYFSSTHKLFILEYQSTCHNKSIVTDLPFIIMY